jgi:peptidylprolyl isomerase
MRMPATLLPGLTLALALVSHTSRGATEDAIAHKPPLMADVLAASKPSDWRPLDPQNTLYLELTSGRVVIELAPRFAPRHIDNIRTLVRERYFDGLPIVRAQDDFVVQWNDPEGSRPLRTAQQAVPAEFMVAARGLPFTLLPDPDTYAPVVGFSEDFPVARDPKTGRAWLVHCYGMVGAGRGNDVDSGNGAELYVVIGQAPRQLDRNITLVGRVVQGMELLSALPRGVGDLGFYDKPEQRVPIKSMRLAAELPAGERIPLEALRTDTPTFADLVESRRNRRDEWYKVPAGRIDVCNVPLPVRVHPRSGAAD